MVISMDKQSHTAKLSLTGHDIIQKFEQIEHDQLANGYYITLYFF